VLLYVVWQYVAFMIRSKTLEYYFYCIISRRAGVSHNAPYNRLAEKRDLLCAGADSGPFIGWALTLEL
jgi:hypothetical protein